MCACVDDILGYRSCANLEKEAKDGQAVGFILGVGHAGVAARVVHHVHLYKPVA